MSTEQPTTPPVVAPNTTPNNPPATPPATPEEINVPKSRFDEESKARQEAERKLAERDASDAEREKKELEAQGKFKEASELAEKRAKTAEERFISNAKSSAIRIAGLQEGVANPDDLVALLDLSKVKVSEDGTVDNDSVKKLVTEAKELKPYLFGGKPNPQNVPVGSGGNPTAPTSGDKPTFKRSQLRDGAFYKANEKEIELALREGRIQDDLS